MSAGLTVQIADHLVAFTRIVMAKATALISINGA